MTLFGRNPAFPVGVDLGFDSIKLLQLERDGKGLAVAASGSCVLSDADRVDTNTRIRRSIEMLPGLLKGHGFRGRRVVTCLPREFVQSKTLRLPTLPEHELRAAIHFEASQLFEIEPQHLAIHFLTAGEVKQGAETRTEVIVLGVDTRALDSILEQFNAAGLRLDALEFEPCAAYRGIERFLRRKEDENVVNVLLDVGARQSQVVIGRGHEVTFVKSIDIGGRTFTESVARKLNVSTDEARELRRSYAAASDADPAKESVMRTIIDATRPAMEELAREVSLCLRYYSVTFRGQRPAKVLLHGGEGNDESLRATLGSFINIPIELRQPLAGIVARKSGGPQTLFRSEWGVAVGNALKRVSDFTPAEPESHYPGRRATDASMVEVVDLHSVLKVAQPAEAAPRAERRSMEGAAHA